MLGKITLATLLLSLSGGVASALGMEQAAQELAASALLASNGDDALAYQRLQYLEHTVPFCHDANLLNGHTYVWRLFDRAGWVVMDDDPMRATRANMGAAQRAQEAADISLCDDILEIYESYNLD